MRRVSRNEYMEVIRINWDAEAILISDDITEWTLDGALIARAVYALTGIEYYVR